MLGKDGRIYDRDFDFDHDGRLDMYELSVYEDTVFGSDEEDEDYDELDDELEDVGLDYDDLADMDEDERREALEEAGLDPDDYDDEF